MDHIKDLPKDVLIYMALTMDIPEVLNFCQSAKYIDNTICKKKKFWQQKIDKDYPTLDLIPYYKDHPKTFLLIKSGIKKKATIHLVSKLDIGNDYWYDKNGGIKLENAYPGITKQLKRGDIIEDVDSVFRGYETDKKLFWDGKKIIYDFNDIREYTDIPRQFRYLSEFPLLYWHRPNIIDHTSSGQGNNLYYPIGNGIKHIYLDDFGISREQMKQIIMDDILELPNNIDGNKYDIDLGFLEELLDEKNIYDETLNALRVTNEGNTIGEWYESL